MPWVKLRWRQLSALQEFTESEFRIRGNHSDSSSEAECEQAAFPLSGTDTVEAYDTVDECASENAASTVPAPPEPGSTVAAFLAALPVPRTRQPASPSFPPPAKRVKTEPSSVPTAAKSSLGSLAPSAPRGSQIRSSRGSQIHRSRGSQVQRSRALRLSAAGTRAKSSAAAAPERRVICEKNGEPQKLAVRQQWPMRKQVNWTRYWDKGHEEFFFSLAPESEAAFGSIFESPRWIRPLTGTKHVHQIRDGDVP